VESISDFDRAGEARSFPNIFAPGYCLPNRGYFGSRRRGLS
jgi:hypothetical protein